MGQELGLTARWDRRARGDGMITGGRGSCDTQLRLRSRLPEQTVPASLLHGVAPRAPPSGGGGQAGAPGTSWHRGFGGISRGPPATTPGALLSVRGPGVLWARKGLGCQGAPRAQRSEPVLPRACEAGGRVGGELGGGGAVCPAPPPKVSDCPAQGSLGRLPFPPPPTPESQGSTPRDVTTDGGGQRRVLLPEATVSAQHWGGSLGADRAGEGQGRRGVGVCYPGPGGGASEPAGWFVWEGVCYCEVCAPG